MNECDPFYCEGLTRGHIFWCCTFWGGRAVRDGVDGVIGLVVDLFMARSLAESLELFRVSFPAETSYSIRYSILSSF